MQAVESLRQTDINPEPADRGPGLVFDNFEEAAAAARAVNDVKGPDHPLFDTVDVEDFGRLPAAGTILAELDGSPTVFRGQACEDIVSSLVKAASDEKTDEPTKKQIARMLEGYVVSMAERASETEERQLKEDKRSSHSQSAKLVPENRPAIKLLPAVMSAEGKLALNGFGSLLSAADALDKVPQTIETTRARKEVAEAIAAADPLDTRNVSFEAPTSETIVNSLAGVPESEDLKTLWGKKVLESAIVTRAINEQAAKHSGKERHEAASPQEIPVSV